MVDNAQIEKFVSEFIQGKELFLVAIKISSTGKITILLDKKGGITIEECAQVSRHIEKCLDRDSEDFELQVSSPGIDMPFLVRQQYYKNAGRRIEVTDIEGRKYTGILKNVTEGGFELETEVKVKGDSRRKLTEKKELSFNYEQVKSARETVIFK